MLRFVVVTVITLSTMAALLHELPTQLNSTISTFLWEKKRSMEIEKLQQIQLSNMHEALEEERHMHALLWDLVPGVLDQLLQKDKASTTPTGSCWELAAKSLLLLLTAMLPDAGISLQLVRPKRRRKVLVCCNRHNVCWPSLHATTGELKWDPKARSIFANGLQASHSFHIEHARQHPRYSEAAMAST